jgi:sterol desaturase/sphingolipid hydroxylase (fatty acid hydroxylase superfamily)
LHEFVLAMLGLGKIASMIHAYPTFAELARKAGDKYNKTRLTRRAKNLALRPRAQMSNDKTGNSKSVIGRLIALLVSVIVFFLAMRFLPVQPWLRNFNDWVGQMGVAGIFIFIAVYAVATVLLAPGQC